MITLHLLVDSADRAAVAINNFIMRIYLQH